MEEFKDQVPETINFSVGYFVGRQSTKKWLVSQEDLECMYTAVRQAGKTDICLWCDGWQEEKDSDSSQKRRRDSSPVSTSRRAVKEKEIDELFVELKEMHVDDLDLSDPQYRLWARTIVNGIHSSKDTPPKVPMISGVTPTRPAKKSIEETVASTVAAVVMNLQGAARPSTHLSPVGPDSGLRISPSKGVDVRGKCYSQLSCLKQLFEDSILTTEEFQEQKNQFSKLKKLNSCGMYRVYAVSSKLSLSIIIIMLTIIT